MQPKSNSFIRSLLFTTILLCPAFSSSSYASDADADAHEAYMQKFMEKYSSGYVEYSNGTLILYAEPHPFSMGAKLVGGIFFGGCSLGCLSANHVSDAGLVLGVIGLGVSVYLLVKFFSDLSIKDSHVPYITFDCAGLSIYDKTSLNWLSVDHLENFTTVEIYTSLHDFGHGSVPITNAIHRNRLSFVDEFGESLLSVSENDSLLPISFGQFKALASHYFDTYGKKG
ncbi:MAG: hypothetical protein WC365_05525 [Candidatus Babeliales bacterium]|jgi:hypothetical protein